MRLWNYVIVFLLLGGILAGCGAAGNQEKVASTPTIYTTIYPLQFIVEEIAGDAVEVVSVYPPGVDEHTYEPTAKDLTQIAEGDAFIYIGAGLEALATTASGALENQDVKLIEVGVHEELFLSSEHDNHEEEEEEEHDGHYHGSVDPHIWLDPVRMISIAEIIAEELSDIYPEEQERFKSNLTKLSGELTTLHEEFEELVAGKSNKKLLVTHAAFGYWEDRYGIEQLAIHGISTENEPSQKDLIKIIDTAEKSGVEHIIFEQNVTTRVSEIIQEEIGAEALIIHNLSVLTEEDITEGRDYLSIMRDNLQVLDQAMN